MTKINYLWK